MMTFYITYTWIVFRTGSKRESALQIKSDILTMKRVKIINLATFVSLFIAVIYTIIQKFFFATQDVVLKTGRGIIILNDS